jgi:adenosylcobinamide-GDP ribazoletransferase
MRSLFFALGFLTSIPVRTPAPQAGDLGRAAIWFPLVGVIIGVVLVVAQLILTRFFAPLLAGALIVVVWIALTGGLHLDGLADCGDGLLSATSRERRLEIMRDPRLGAFGGMLLIMHLLIKTLAVASLTAPIALLFAPALARWLMLFVAQQPAARPGGLGAAFSAGLPKESWIGAAIVPLVLIVPGAPRSIYAALAAALVTFGIARLARSRLGGVTGDVFGLTIEVVEVVVLLVFCINTA